MDSTPIFANFLLKDIERVEVLRGPQGTLYGSGAMGGTVRYIMNKPDIEETMVKASTSLSQTDGSGGNNYSADVILNLPLGDKAAFRFSGGTVDNAGVIDYVNLYELADGKPVVKTDDGSCVSVKDPSLTAEEIAFNGSCYTSREDADTVEITHARAALRVDFSDSVSAIATYQTQSDEIGARRAVSLGGNLLGDSYGDDDLGSTMLEPSEREVDLFSLEVEADLGFATLTSTTSKYEHTGNGWRDNTSLWVTGRDWFHWLYTGNPRPVAHVDAGYSEEALVQEFRLVSNSDGSVDWVAGAYYMDQERETYNLSYLLGLDEYGRACADIGAACAADGQWWVGYSLQETDFDYTRQETFEDLAVYGELTYHISDSFHLTGGLRWFNNALTNDTALGFPLFAGDSVDFEEYPDQEEDDIQFKLNASWDISESLMAYATYSEGFRRGGSNAVPCGGFFVEPNCEAASTYGKDTAQNYELGLKGETDRARYSANVFYVDWQDPQLNTATYVWAFFMAQNGDSAATSGLELDAEFALTDSLRLHAGYTYTKAELTADLVGPQAGNLIAEDGHQLPGIPENVATIALSHRYFISEGMELASRIGGYYQSQTINSVQDTSIQDEHDAFSLWNASASLLTDSWVLSLYAKNLLNDEGVTGSYPSAYMSTDTGIFENYYGNNQRQYITTPRTIGLSASYTF
ncbi:TonB-dependent receptor [Microbulbifer taiwanensis]|uniref:TonB-dependent receptor n=1 Tax=Microbulbifer taiwanensis TaxID=986746 RepID=UPI0036109D04